MRFCFQRQTPPVPFPGIGAISLPTVLRRVAYPVEPFDFLFVQYDLPLPLVGSVRDRLGKQPDLFGQLDDGHANEFQRVHIKSVDVLTIRFNQAALSLNSFPVQDVQNVHAGQ